MGCQRCGADDAARLGVAIYDDDPDSREEGLHLADWGVTLCAECRLTLEEKLDELFEGEEGNGDD